MTNEEIMNAVKPAICSQLKAPASAQFPSELISITGDDASGYKVEGYVDSQNGYGAMIRNDFTADVRIENGCPKVTASSVAVKANRERSQQYQSNYFANLIITAIGGIILYFIISAFVGL